jgi:hypothetical protein
VTHSREERKNQKEADCEADTGIKIYKPRGQEQENKTTMKRKGVLNRC